MVEHLQAVVQRVAFRVILERLLHVFQRQQQRFVELEAIDLVGRVVGRGGQVEVGILARQELLQLGDAGPLDRLAGDRAFEDVVGLVGRVDRQLEREAVDEMDVREDPLLAVLADLLPLDV